MIFKLVFHQRAMPCPPSSPPARHMLGASPSPQAGKVRERGELESTAACIKSEERPPTPDRIKPYRGPNQQEPGRTFKHFGTARDPEPDGVFGVATRPDPEEGVQHALNQGPQDELGRFRQEQAERVYARCARICEVAGAARREARPAKRNRVAVLPSAATSGPRAWRAAWQAGAAWVAPEVRRPALSGRMQPL